MSLADLFAKTRSTVAAKLWPVPVEADDPEPHGDLPNVADVDFAGLKTARVEKPVPQRLPSSRLNLT